MIALLASENFDAFLRHRACPQPENHSGNLQLEPVRFSGVASILSGPIVRGYVQQSQEAVKMNRLLP